MTSARHEAVLAEGLVLPAEPGGPLRLKGSRCLGCGEVFFPRRDICSNCSGRESEDFTFGPEGRLYSFTVVRDPASLPPRPVGQADFEGRVRVQAALLCDDPSPLRVEMPVVLVPRPLGTDSEGRERISYAFRPRDAGV